MSLFAIGDFHLSGEPPVFAIGDFHLSGEPPAKPMEVFSPNWENHFEKIRRNWLTKITETDTVIICGDTSWAMSLETAMPARQPRLLVDFAEKNAAGHGRQIYVFTEQLFCLRRRCRLRFAWLDSAVVGSVYG